MRIDRIRAVANGCPLVCICVVWQSTVVENKIPLLAISGSVGVGKTAVLIEIHDILEKRQVPHACVERDALGYSWPPQGRFNERIIELNLSCVATTFLAAGAERLVIAGVIETPHDLLVYRRCIPNAQIQVCRLTAALELRRERLRSREKGAGLDWHLERTAELDRILDEARIDHFSVDNGDRPLRDVASEVLARAGWLPSHF
jgi:adenylylsulfate kinase